MDHKEWTYVKTKSYFSEHLLQSPVCFRRLKAVLLCLVCRPKAVELKFEEVDLFHACM
jgi:hypothetical protein